MGKRTNRYERALEGLARLYEQELIAEAITDSTHGDGAPDESDSGEKAVFGVINLAQIPIEEWGALKVSQVSSFRDLVWDWRQEGSPIYKDTTFFNWDLQLDEKTKLLVSENHPLVLLMRALLFYLLPQNAVTRNIRSYNTVVGRGKQLLLLARFLSAHGVYVDPNGDGTYRVANDLAPTHFQTFLETSARTAHERYGFVMLVAHWQELSRSGLLPTRFQLGYQVVDKTLVTKCVKEFEEAKTPYLPITLETVALMTARSIEVIEKYGDDILFFYGLVWPVIAGKEAIDSVNFDWNKCIDELKNRKTDLWKMEQFTDAGLPMSGRNVAVVVNVIQSHPDWRASKYFCSSSQLSCKATRQEIKEIANDLGIVLPEVLSSIGYDLSAIRMFAMQIATMLRNAVAFVVFLVTGMRRSELVHIKSGDYWKKKNRQDEYRLRFMVFKTSDYSQGDIVEVPIPRLIYDGLIKLEKLTEHARKQSGTDYLMVSTTVSFGKHITLNAVNQFLDRWCEELGLEERIHPHQFRKTLAMFAIYQDSRNLPVIKRLFSHKSLKMTLAYIIKMPGLAKEIKLAILRENMELVGELLEAAEKNILGGKGGERVKATFKSSRAYHALLNDNGWETLEQYVESLLDEGATLLHRAPLAVICLKSPTRDQTSPCDPPHGPLGNRIHPIVHNCDALDCKWAAFTEASMTLPPNFGPL